jgi:hypothetical protein
MFTKIKGWRDRGEIHIGMAYFGGTGPPGATCGTCVHKSYTHADADGTLRGCAMFNKLTGKHGPAIQAQWDACKYYEKKPEDK